MTLTECAEKAALLKRSGYNCCQAAAAALAEMEGTAPDDLLKIAAGFGAGMGNMEVTCGALAGAVMMAGRRTDGRGTVRYARQISENFKAKCGSVTCRDLKGYGAANIFCPCEQCVRNAVLAYGEVMGLSE